MKGLSSVTKSGKKFSSENERPAINQNRVLFCNFTFQLLIISVESGERIDISTVRNIALLQEWKISLNSQEGMSEDLTKSIVFQRMTQIILKFLEI